MVAQGSEGKCICFRYMAEGNMSVQGQKQT
jgi:hypothetical protein